MIYPAKFASCIAVAATTSSDVRASFSSTGSDMTLAAPGANILSTFLFGLHLTMDGTSMACPHVAGAAALCIAAGVSDVEGQLIATADDLGEPGWDPWYGHGLVNVAEAVGVDPGDDPVDNPPYVFITSHYDFDIVSGTVGVTADASDDNGVTQVEFFVDGTTVSESIGVDTDNTDAHYGVTWDSTAVTDDLYIITATATDTTGQTASYSIFVFVSNAVNNSPVANDDADTTQEGTPVIIDVLANDSDVDGDPLTVTAVTEPANGTASINPDNTVTYTPDGGFTGDDTFTYTVEDDSGGTDSAQVNVTVTPTNDPPDALDDSDTTDEDTLVTIDVLSNDSDPDIGDTLTVTAVTQPADGTATINPDNTVNYTPDLNFNGGDTFTYTISDGKGGTDTANVSVTVVPVNDSPVANDDVNTTQEDTPVIIDVLANDTDVDGDTLTVTALTQPANGTASINLDYTVTYTPADSFIGGDTFTYTIDDGNGGTDTATVTVTVEPPPAPTIHVGNLQGQSAKLSKGRWEASVTVTVHDEDHIAVSDAWVTGVWSGAMTGTESLPTAGGIVTFTNSTKGGKSATFTVTNITLAGYDYDAADNHATSITVSK
jgi:hypothetical protein